MNSLPDELAAAAPAEAISGSVAQTAHDFDAFLSYSTRGDYWVSRRVESFLEAFHARLAPSGTTLRPLRVCRDGSDFRQVLSTPLSADDAIWQRIQQSLQRSRRLLVLCSPESAASPWVQQELEWTLHHKGAAAVLLAVTAGDDPSGHPSGVVPPAAIQAGLHRNHIWYDLREWRGVRGPLVRNAEDELVRLALDLLEWPHDAQSDLATIWQREDLSRRRRLLSWGLAAASVSVVGAAVAGWQFHEATVRAEEAAAASLIRIADAQASASPLTAALVFAEAAAQRAPADALDVGHRLLDKPIARARLRGHRHRLVTGRLTADGFAVTVDQRGHVLRRAAIGIGPDQELASAGAVAVADAVVSAGGTVTTLGLKDGEIRQLRAGGPSRACMTLADDPRYLHVSTDSRAALITGYKAQVYGCEFDDAGMPAARVLRTDSAIAAAWSAGGEPHSWFGVSNLGVFWRFAVREGVAMRMPDEHVTAQLRDAGIVHGAVAGAQGALAVQAGDALFVGDMGTDRVRLERLPGNAKVTAAAFSPDGARLAVVTADGAVTVYARAGLKLLRVLEHRLLFYRLGADRSSAQKSPESFEVAHLAWSPDGQQLATLQPGRGVQLWQMADGRAEEPHLLTGHDGAQDMVWSDDSRWLATPGDDGELFVWTVERAGATATRVAARLYAAAVDRRTRTLALGTGDGRVLVFPQGRLEAQPVEWSAADECGDDKRPRAIGLLHVEAEGGAFWSASQGGLVRRWDELATSAQPAPLRLCAVGTGHAFNPKLKGMVFIDGQQRLSLADRQGVRVLDAVALPSPTEALAVSESGRWIAAGLTDGSVVRWDLAAGVVQRKVLKAHTDEVLCLAIDDQEGRVLSGSKDRKAMFSSASFDAAGMAVWQGDDGWMESCTLLGDRALAGSSTGRLWRLDTAHPGSKSALAGRVDTAHIGPIGALHLDRQGTLLVTGGGMDGRVRVWDGQSRKQLADVPMESSVVAIVPDADLPSVTVVAESGLIRRVLLTVPGVQAALQRATSAALSPTEREALLNESADDAYSRYVERERARDRTPLPRDWRFAIPF
ncbi:TIR domain-containing protein [Ideonella sp. A 288]|uniref:TIR domain-containing protein n=1 Tax=Ideonella sp. A 288 TaxID=1962181 RepID=UPI001303A44E|nr:TIR domain-containing protein [Ideonella sp. A 288]